MTESLLILIIHTEVGLFTSYISIDLSVYSVASNKREDYEDAIKDAPNYSSYYPCLFSTTSN